MCRFSLNSHRSNYQHGFTLVEIAIVLVIIALLLGGIIKGREMINQAKLKGLVKMAESLAAAVHSYQDKYGELPGDDTMAKTHLASGPGGCAADSIVNGDGDGHMDETFDTVQHLACANLIKGSFNGEDQTLKSPYSTDVYITFGTVQGFTGNGLYFQHLEPEVAIALDKALDDGIYNTGAVRGEGTYTEMRNLAYFFY